MSERPMMFAGMTNQEYQKRAALSVSAIKELAKSPMHLRHKLDHPQKPTPAMQIGTAFHAAALEPESFSNVAVVAPDCDRRTKDGKAVWAEFEQEAQGKILLKKPEYEQIGEMVLALMTHKEASKLIQMQGLTEVSCFWTDHRGFKCKCRPDRVTESGIVLDLKTTDDASPEGFARACGQYRYHWQAAWYLTGLTVASDYKHDDFRLIAVEKKPPYGVGVYRVPRIYTDIAHEQMEPFLDTYQRCILDNFWPGYSETTESLQMPVWALKTDEFKEVA